MNQYGFYNGKEIEDNTFEIGNICIKPEYQNKGIGTAVLKEIIFENKERDVKLQVLKINEKAIKLYKKIGFKKVEESKTHYIMVFGKSQHRNKNHFMQEKKSQYLTLLSSMWYI